VITLAALRGLLPMAGLVAGPAAWALNTQLGQILPYAECGGWFRPSLVFSVAAMMLSLAGAYLSWRTRGEGTVGFGGRLGALLGLLFAFALLLQGLSTLILSGCDR
jgi:hypothetical protein